MDDSASIRRKNWYPSEMPGRVTPLLAVTVGLSSLSTRSYLSFDKRKYTVYCGEVMSLVRWKSILWVSLRYSSMFVNLVNTEYDVCGVYIISVGVHLSPAIPCFCLLPKRDECINIIKKELYMRCLGIGCFCVSTAKGTSRPTKRVEHRW